VPLRLAAFVPVQPPGPLNDEVDGGQVGQHQVEVEIEALLDDLGGDDDGSPGPVRRVAAFIRLAKLIQYLLLDGLPPDRRKAGVEEDQVVFREVEGACLPGVVQDAEDVLGTADGVADDGRAAAVSQLLA
jgi:hypothetical protein